MRKVILLAALPAIAASPAAAHEGELHPGSFGWTFDPWITIPIALAAILYARGAVRLFGQARNSRPSIALGALSYSAGWLALAGALVSPLHELGEALFTFHMIEHEIVIAVAAPLMVLARPSAALLWSLPDRMRSAIGHMVRTRSVAGTWRWLSGGTTATMLHGIAIWGWHAPLFFDAAIDTPLLHRLQHLSFFGTALLFWWSVLRSRDKGFAAWHLLVTMLHTSALGALMALAPVVLYTAQTRQASLFGMTPLEDQQLAGLVMWVPTGTIYAGAALALVAMWISRSGRRALHAGPQH